MPATRPPPPTGTTTTSASGASSASSRPMRALAGDHLGVVERRHVHGPGLGGEGLSQGDAVVHHLAFEPDLGPVGPGGGHLGERGAAGHEDGRRPPGQGGGQGHPLGVVAGRGGHHRGPGGSWAMWL